MKTNLLTLIAIAACVASTQAQTADIYQSTLAESDPLTSQISTAELRDILKNESATVFDARPFAEYAIGHIPGVVHVGGKPGATDAHYTSDAAAIAGAVDDQKAAAIVVYCSGLFCGRSKRAAKDLTQAGFTNVRRYQLGMPVWRALGGVTEIEREGIDQIHGKDATAVFIDVREPDAFQASTLPGAHNVSIGDTKDAKDAVEQARKDGTLPVSDHNTRIVVFGRDGAQARPVAEYLTRRAFHNVAYFPGSFEVLQNLAK